jgi:hypothetical protein
MSKPKYKCRFQGKWLDKNSYPAWTWLQRVPGDDNKARCSLCRTDFDISNMGLSSIKSHEKGKKHIENSSHVQQQQPLTFVSDRPQSSIDSEEKAGTVIDTTKSCASGSGEVDTATASGDLANSIRSPISTKGCMNSFLLKDAVTKTEILWSLNAVMCHSSLRSTANASSLFPLMFPDSDIASKFSVHKDKCSYMITYGLGPYFVDLLSKQVTSCEYYTVSFDESLNSVAQKGQMDIVVRFVDKEKGEVATRYLTSTFVEHATAVDLLNAFTSALAERSLDLKKLVQVCMDGPNVNLKFLSELKEFIKNTSDPDCPQLIESGTCSLHIVHGAYKTAHNACDWKINDFLRMLYYLFKNFPSRRAAYKEATNSAVFPLKFCCIRWVENVKVLQRALDILPHLKTYVSAVSKKPPASSCFQKVATALKDELLAAKLGFMQSVALQLEPFLTMYQSNLPLLPFLYDDIHSLLRNLMMRFVTKDTMAAASTAAKLVEIDLTNKNNIKKISEIDIGFAASAACKGVAGIAILSFREQCITFLKHVCRKLIDKCPAKYKVVKGATCLTPSVIGSTTLRESRITAALELFVDKKRMLPSTADAVKREYLRVFAKQDVQEKVKRFRRDEDRLDHLMRDVLTEASADDKLTSFVFQILTLFHGNAAVERSFSVNKEVLVENLSEHSLIAQRAVHDSVMAVGGIASVKITKTMILEVRNASARRTEALAKKKNEDTEKTNRLKRVALEIKQLESKKAKITQQAKEESVMLDEELKKLRSSLK